MILIKLQGGLGNQMFQYALGGVLSLKRKSELKFDLSWYEGQSPSYRRYALDAFAIRGEIASKRQLSAFRSPLARLMEAFRSPATKRIVHEKAPGFDPAVLEIPNNRYLDGYWQSEKYFRDKSDLIKKEFTLKNGLGKTAQKIAEKIQETDSISIHVRRGDYISNLKFSAVHGTLPLSYYELGMKTVEQKVKNPHYFLFSDDLEWATQHLSSRFPVTVVTHEEMTENEQMHLMALCKHHIIANSSFSWWGAWLDSRPDKIVIAPKNWFADPSKNASDIIPPSWLKI